MSPDAPSAGRIEGGEHLLPVRIYYEDTDFSGLVYHANYLRFFERGRSDFLRLAGVRHAEMLAGPGMAFAVRAMSLDFLKAARIDDALLVRSRFSGLKGPRIHIAQRLERDGEALVAAAVEVCCIDRTGRPMRPPALLLERLKPFLEPGASSF